MNTIYKLGDDQYVVWSDVTGGPSAWGSRDEIIDCLKMWEQERVAREVAERMQRADEFGTSSRLGRRGESIWYHQQFVVRFDEMAAWLDTFDEATDEFDNSKLEVVDLGDDDDDDTPAYGIPRVPGPYEPWHITMPSK